MTKHADFFKPLIVKVLPKLTPFGAALLGTTMTFTMAQGSAAPNVIPQEASMTANLRFAPGDDSKLCIEKLRRLAARYDIETHPMECREASPMVDVDSADYKYFADTVAKVFPDCGAAPLPHLRRHGLQDNADHHPMRDQVHSVQAQLRTACVHARGKREYRHILADGRSELLQDVHQGYK